MLSKDRYFPATKMPSIGIEQAVVVQVIVNFAGQQKITSQLQLMDILCGLLPVECAPTSLAKHSHHKRLY
jgi:hypothetical protein